MNYKLSLVCFFLCINILHGQYKNNIKTNVLSLIISTPQLSYERQISNHSSLTLSAYRGQFTLISETKIQGANILFRRYLDNDKNLSGVYPELGLSLHGQYRFDKSKYNYMYGPRVGFGYQFGKNKWVFDLGLGIAIYGSRVDNFDNNGNTIGKVWQIDPTMRLNSSVGYRF